MSSITAMDQFSYLMSKPEVGERLRQTHIRFQPQGWYNSGSTAAPNNYINFNFRSDGFLDPLSVYVHIEVDTANMPANTVYQLDNSAQSLIGQYIARVNGTELIRLQEYDEIAALLYDLHIGVEERDTRVGEGVGRNRITHRALANRGGGGGAMTCKGMLAVADESLVWPPSWTAWSGTTYDGSSAITASNWCYSATAGAGLKPYKIFGGMEANNEGADALLDYNYTSYLDLFNLEDSQGVECAGFGVGTSDTYHHGYSNYGWGYAYTSNYGMVRPNTEAAVGTMEYYLSNYVLKPTIMGGIPVYERSTRATFQIPLLCPVFGALADHGKLIPMRLFDNLEFEFAINPYAFFVGGRSSHTYRGNATSTTGLPKNWADWFVADKEATPSRTNWSITKFEIVGELTFPTTADTNAILGRVQNSGFQMDFKTWFLGPKTKYPGGTSLNSTIQINNGFNSLNLLAFYFQPADYQLYSHVRKHKRISNNLTSMQLRIGTDYVPSLPVTGHAGNLRPPTFGTNKGNYVEFYVHTMKAFGKWLKMGTGSIINPTNYTLNTTGYQVDGAFTSQGVNIGYDMSLFWENTIVPRSVFAFDLEKFDVNPELRSGLDTTNTRPFDLLLTNDNGVITHSGIAHTTPVTVASKATTTISDTAFPRPFYLYIWMYYDARIAWTPSDGWRAEGRV